MTLKPTQIIEAQTAAVSAVASMPIMQKEIPATIFATGLAGAEAVAVLFSVDGGANFEPLSQDGADLELTATDNTLTINSPLLLGVTKSSTVGASGVFLMTDNPAK